MKKIIATVLSFVGLTLAQAQEIYMPIPFSSTGTIGPAVPIISQELNSRGWKIDYRLIGGCGPVKEMLVTNKSTDKPIVTIWGSSWQRNTDSTCYLDIDKYTTVGVLLYNSYFLCGPRQNLDFKFQSGSQYSVAVNQYNTTADLESLEQLSLRLGVKFRLVVYKNSGAISQAFNSGETDLIFVNSGIALGFVKRDQTKCLFTNSKNSEYNLPTISQTLDKPTNGEQYTAFTVMTRGNLTVKQFDKLKNDLTDIINNSQSLKQYIESKNLFRFTSDQQLKFINNGLKD